MIVLTLAHNVALLVALGVGLQMVTRRWEEDTPMHLALSGLLFGGMAVLTMATPLKAAPGVIFDGRSVVLSVAGLFGGPAVGAIAAAMAIGYRLWLGGTGQWVGVAVIVEATLLGIAFRRLHGRDARRMRPLWFWGFGLITSVVMALTHLTLPGGIGPRIIGGIIVPVVVLFPADTLLVCQLLLDQEERRHAEHAMRALNESLERTVSERTRQVRDANQQLAEVAIRLKQSNDQLVKANEAKAEFLRSMSHELRTPLNSIIGFSDIMKQGLAGEVNAEQARQLAMINSSGLHLLSLINDVLDLSRLEAGAAQVQCEDIDPARLARQALDTVAPDALAKGLDLCVRAPDEGLTLRSDPQKVRQILLNLLGNAVKFTDAGSVTVEVGMTPNGMVRFTVTDTGPGIPAAMQEHVFGDFAQGDLKPVQGSGLGLAISRRLATLLGGVLALRSEVGAGSAFTLVLPATPGE